MKASMTVDPATRARVASARAGVLSLDAVEGMSATGVGDLAALDSDSEDFARVKGASSALAAAGGC
jgi:hypothetical protein